MSASLATARCAASAPNGYGPRDLGAGNQDALGGNFYAVAHLETDFPLGLPEEYGITGGAFVDVGSVWGLDNTAGTAGTVDDRMNLRSIVGFTVYWKTPIGPLRLDFTHALQEGKLRRGADLRSDDRDQVLMTPGPPSVPPRPCASGWRLARSGPARGGAARPPPQVLTLDQDRLYGGSLYGKALEAKALAATQALAAENRQIEADLSAEEARLTTQRSHCIGRGLRHPGRCL